MKMQQGYTLSELLIFVVIGCVGVVAIYVIYLLILALHKFVFAP